MVLIFQLEGKRSKLYYISAGVFLVALGFLMLTVFKMNAALAIVMMVVITFGEMLSMPFMNAFWIARTTPHNRGQYAGLQTMAWSVAQTFGPFIGAQIADHSGFHALWWSVVGLCLVSSIGFALMNRKRE
jgi:predicted MFS family arabinose efflux permease